METNGIAAIYARISKKEREGFGQGDSIENQICLARSWIREMLDGAWELQEYRDEGYSGTSLDRPAVKKLLAGIFLGRISVLVVKDFSRLSRNHLQLSELLEVIFPRYPVRVISIGDAYDSAGGQEMGIQLGVQSVFFEYYCRDISRKVKQALAVKKESGFYAVAKVPFGYRKNMPMAGMEGDRPQAGSQWVIDETEAEIVRDIFERSGRGEGCVQIAASLSDADHRWEASRVWEILHDPVYMGKQVWHKYETVYQDGFVTRKLPRKDWFVQEGHHPAIISMEDYHKVSEMHPATDALGKKKGKRHLFHGMTRCGCCGGALCRHRQQRDMLICKKKHGDQAFLVKMDALWGRCWAVFGKRGEVCQGEEKRLFLEIFIREIYITRPHRIYIYAQIAR